MTLRTTLPAPVSAAPDVAADTAPPLTRLVAVELRKAVDTRAGTWLLGVTALLSASLVVLRVCFGGQEDRTLVTLFQLSQVPVGVLLPVVGILLVTSEWSQRTALTTFALVPHRGRVVGAKLVATSLLAVAASAVAVGAAAVGFAVGSLLDRTAGGWHLPPVMYWQMLVAQVLGVLMGVAFGLVLLSSAPAIVVYFVLPTVWSVLGQIISGLRTPAEWLDTGRTMATLFEPDALTGREWAQLGTSVALWLLVPMLVGLWRLRRKEIS